MELNIFTGVCIFIIIGLMILVWFLNRDLTTANTSLIDMKDKLDRLKEDMGKMPTMSMKDRVDTTQNLFEIIDTLIQYEILNRRRYDAFLKQKTTIGDVDNTATEIAGQVFKTLNPSIFGDSNAIITDAGIMDYIQKRTIIELLVYLQNNAEGTR